MERTSTGVIVTRIMKFFLFIMLIFFQCSRQIPPSSDYQMVLFLPIPSLQQGYVFVYQDTVFVLYRTDDNEYLTLREYTVVWPSALSLVDITSVEMDLNPYTRYVQHENLVILFHPYSGRPAYIFHLQTHDIIDIGSTYSVNSVACQDNCVFLATQVGLVILDITDVYNAQEVFCENDTTHNFYSMIALNDTILFEHNSNGEYAFWNIHDVYNPTVMCSGTSGIFGTLEYVAILDSTIIAAAPYALYRFSFDYSDSLHLEVTTSCDRIVNAEILDSLLYVNHGYRISIYNADDFSEQNVIFSIVGLDGSPYYTSMTVERETIYTVAYKEGIYVYERRE